VNADMVSNAFVADQQIYQTDPEMLSIFMTFRLT